MRFCFQVGVLSLTMAAVAPVGTVYQASASALSARAVPVTRADPRSGHLIQTIVVAPKVVRSREVKPRDTARELSSEAALDSNVKELVEATSRQYDVNPALVDSVIQVESNYNPFAVSPKGAQGIMQLLPSTARRFGVRNTFDPKQNIEGGVKYLKFLQDTFKDDRLAVAAYNAGEKAVAKYNNVPPYPETMAYVAQVGKRYGKAKRAAEAKKLAAAKPEPPKPEYNAVRQYVDDQGRLHLTTQ